MDRLAPSGTRSRRGAASDALSQPGGAPELLRYRPPLDWPAMLQWLAPRATPGVELVTDRLYRRAVRIREHRGVVTIEQEPGVPALRIAASPSLLPAMVPLRSRLRHLFDLDADPAIVREHLARDAWLRPLVEQRPGLRVVGAVDGFELAVRAVLGQQVSVRGASTLAGRLAALLGDPLEGGDASGSPVRLPVRAEQLANADESRVAGIGVPRARARTLVTLARATADGRLDLAPGTNPDRARAALLEMPGIGDWTADYVLMRALRWPDAFPAADLGLRKAAGGVSAAELTRRAEAWRPWRAYAAVHLWQSLSERHRA
ncbi:MAG TPA: AlkA N-terminal domain-containing protein [Gemmatimonadales bacterium]|nr:AlkA N-terminal domain-containing protein [Gemmatimonadales bacterium]